MAGYFPNIPGHRFQLDIDGTHLYQLSNDLVSSTNRDGQLPIIADTDDDYWNVISGGYYVTGRQGWIALVFPEKRDILGYYATVSGANGGPGAFDLDVSPDTTDGLDGAWIHKLDKWLRNDTTVPYWRSDIKTVNYTGVKGIRFGIGNDNASYYGYDFRLHVLHLYGNISLGENPDRLRFWHATDNLEAAPHQFDFGDVAQGTFSIKTFRLRNNSATLTANAVTLTRSSTSFPETEAGLEFSADGAVWATTLDVGNLGPGSTSSILRVRRTVAMAETPSIPKNGRLVASATSWV